MKGDRTWQYYIGSLLQQDNSVSARIKCLNRKNRIAIGIDVYIVNSVSHIVCEKVYTLKCTGERKSTIDEAASHLGVTTCTINIVRIGVPGITTKSAGAKRKIRVVAWALEEKFK